MSEFDKKVATTRASIVILLEQSLTAMAEKFVALGETLRNEEKDAEERAAYLQSEPARIVWGGVWNSEVMSLTSVLKEFDKVDEKTKTGPYTYEIARSNENWIAGTDRTSVDQLAGNPAALKKYLAKAGFKLSLVPGQGMYMNMVVSRS